MLYIVGRPPRETRVGVIVQVEDGQACCGLAGYQGDHPPANLAGFLDFAKSLSQPDVFDVLAHSELLSPIARYRIPASVRRDYAKAGVCPAASCPSATPCAPSIPPSARAWPSQRSKPKLWIARSPASTAPPSHATI